MYLYINFNLNIFNDCHTKNNQDYHEEYKIKNNTHRLVNFTYY